jgi:hypothetical protein
MSASTLPISEASQKLLSDLAAQTGQSVQQVLDHALEDYRRKVFFKGLAADFAALKADPEAWADELAERDLWDTTSADGLDPDERWTEDGKVIPPAEEARG